MRWRSALGPAFLAVVACAPPRANLDVEGPAFSLGPDAEDAEFLLTLCIDGPAVTVQETYAHVEFELTRAAGQGPATVRGLGPADPRRERRIELSTAAEPPVLALDLNATGPWEDRAGPRCAEPQRVRLEASGDALTRVAVSWKAFFTVIYVNETCDPDRLSQDDLRIEIEPVPR